jgi:predicted protein tyrosine phosphatase
VELPDHAARLEPRHVVSLVESAMQPPTPAGVAAERHLRLAIDDIDEPVTGAVLPEETHVTRLVEFLREAHAAGPLLLHCAAGISRSMAAALIALALEEPGRERHAARYLRERAPHAWPNRRIVTLADRLLRREGALLEACLEMGEPRRPLLEGPLVELSLDF